MKFYRQRIVYLLTIVWLTIFGAQMRLNFKNEILLGGKTSPRFMSQMIFLGFVLTFVMLLGLLYFKKVSKLSWRQFISSEIDALDDDERAVELDRKIRRIVSNIVTAISILIIAILISVSDFMRIDLTIFEVLVILGLIYTFYIILNLCGFSIAYKTDEIPKIFNRKVLLITVGVITILSFYFFIIQTFKISYVDKSEVITIVAVNHTDDAIAYSVSIEGYQSSYDSDTFVVESIDFSRILNFGDRYIVYRGESKALKEASLNQGLSIYEDLENVKLIHYDMDNHRGVLKISK